MLQPPATAGGAADIDVVRAAELIKAGAKAAKTVVLDVRTHEEYGAGHIKDSVNLDFHGAGFKDRLAGLDKKKTYIVHCAVGGRSSKAAQLMSELGFTRVFNMTGGFSAWTRNGLPSTR